MKWRRKLREKELLLTKADKSNAIIIIEESFDLRRLKAHTRYRKLFKLEFQYADIVLYWMHLLKVCRTSKMPQLCAQVNAGIKRSWWYQKY